MLKRLERNKLLIEKSSLLAAFFSILLRKSHCEYTRIIRDQLLYVLTRNCTLNEDTFSAWQMPQQANLPLGGYLLFIYGAPSARGRRCGDGISRLICG